MVAHVPNSPEVAASPGAPGQSVGRQGRRLSGGLYGLVVSLVVVGGLWLLVAGGLLEWGGVAFFSPANLALAAVIPATAGRGEGAG